MLSNMTNKLYICFIKNTYMLHSWKLESEQYSDWMMQKTVCLWWYSVTLIVLFYCECEIALSMHSSYIINKKYIYSKEFWMMQNNVFMIVQCDFYCSLIMSEPR